MTEFENPLLTTVEAAEFLHTTKGALVYWRRNDPDYGPPFIRVGRLIFYRLDDLLDWIADTDYPLGCWSQM